MPASQIRSTPAPSSSASCQGCFSRTPPDTNSLLLPGGFVWVGVSQGPPVFPGLRVSLAATFQAGSGRGQGSAQRGEGRRMPRMLFGGKEGGMGSPSLLPQAAWGEPQSRHRLCHRVVGVRARGAELWGAVGPEWDPEMMGTRGLLNVLWVPEWPELRGFRGSGCAEAAGTGRWQPPPQINGHVPRNGGDKHRESPAPAGTDPGGLQPRPRCGGTAHPGRPTGLHHRPGDTGGSVGGRGVG